VELNLRGKKGPALNVFIMYISLFEYIYNNNNNKGPWKGGRKTFQVFVCRNKNNKESLGLCSKVGGKSSTGKKDTEGEHP